MNFNNKNLNLTKSLLFKTLNFVFRSTSQKTVCNRLNELMSLWVLGSEAFGVYCVKKSCQLKLFGYWSEKSKRVEFLNGHILFNSAQLCFVFSMKKAKNFMSDAWVFKLNNSKTKNIGDIQIKTIFVQNFWKPTTTTWVGEQFGTLQRKKKQQKMEKTFCISAWVCSLEESKNKNMGNVPINIIFVLDVFSKTKKTNKPPPKEKKIKRNLHHLKLLNLFAC